MEIWITRDQTGILLGALRTPDDIEENLKELQVYDELSPAEHVKVELTGQWVDIKQFFQDIQLLADFVRATDFDKDSEKDKLITRLQERKLISV